MIRGPGIQAGSVYPGLGSNVDAMPTLLVPLFVTNNTFRVLGVIDPNGPVNEKNLMYGESRTSMSWGYITTCYIHIQDLGRGGIV